MAKKKQQQLEELSRVELKDGTVLIHYEDGSIQIIPAPITLTSEQASELFGSEEDEEEDEDEDDSDDEEEDEDEDDSDDEEEDEDEDDSDDEEELTPEDLAEMDFEELEDLVDDNDLETDPDEYDEEDVEKLRKAIAKELGITLPRKKRTKK